MTEDAGAEQGSAHLVRRRTLDYVDIRFPSVLCELDAAESGADCMLAACEVPENVFRPNIVFTSRNSNDALVDCVWREQEALAKRYPHSCLLLMSPYMRPSKIAQGLEPIGFLTTSSYTVGDRAVVVKRWDFSTGEKHICATASFLPSQMAVVESTFTWIVDNLDFRSPQAAFVLSAQKDSQIGASIDATVSERLGYPVLNQLYFPRPALKRRQYYKAEDVGSWLLELGADIKGPHLLDIVLTTCGKEGNYQIVRGNIGPVVLRTAPSTIGDAIIYHGGQPEYTAYSCPVELILTDVLAWLDVLPNYTFQDEISVSKHELEKRISATNPDRAWKKFEFYGNGMVRNWIAIPGKHCFYDEGLPDSNGLLTLNAIPHFHVLNTVAEVIGKALTGD